MSHEFLIPNRVMLCPGDSRHFLKDEPENRYDSVVCDPPYALVSIVKRFGGTNAAPAKGNAAYMRASAGFMGKQWDTGDTAHAIEFWAEVLRVLKPGGHVVAFAGTRTYHRMACAIEDSGFEIRDQIGWAFGQGFPKSHDIGDGWGTALKPAFEPICLARKPLSEKTVAANVLKWGTGAINIDGCRIPGWKPQVTQGVNSNATSFNAAKTKQLSGDFNEGCWPANLVHDGSEEVLAAFPETTSVLGFYRNGKSDAVGSGNGVTYMAQKPQGAIYSGNGGSAARFFYTTKADADDRLGSKHPTVKPVDLMQWLCRLVTPKGGLILDPFAGTGSTAEAAFREGFRCMLVEREAEYQDDIRRRMRLVMSGPDERRRESIKAKTNGKPQDLGPLFSGLAEPAERSLPIRPPELPNSEANSPSATPNEPNAISLLAKLRRSAGRVGGIPKLDVDSLE